MSKIKLSQKEIAAAIVQFVANHYNLKSSSVHFHFDYWASAQDIVTAEVEIKPIEKF